MLRKDPIRYGLPLYRQVTGAPRLYGLNGVLTGKSESETIAILEAADLKQTQAWQKLTSVSASLVANSASMLSHKLESLDNQLKNKHARFAEEAPKWFSDFDSIYAEVVSIVANYNRAIKDIDDSVKLFTQQETFEQQAVKQRAEALAQQSRVSEAERQAAAGGIVSYATYKGVEQAKAAAAATGLSPFELLGVGTGSLVALGAGIFGALWLLKKV